MSDSLILEITKGVAKVPGDTNSAEQGLDSINLLDKNGFSCDIYDIKLPSLKSSAVYADSPLSDGRILLSGALGNVVETIKLNLTAGSLLQLSAMLSKLMRFKQDCTSFWDTFGQIDPIYIKHQVSGEPGPRYALLYDIDVDIDDPINPNEPSRTVTIVIEREFGWRGIAPGANPKQWTTQVFDQRFGNSNADLTSGNVHLVDQIIQNRLESNTTDTALLSRNYFDIPAASVPGDLPAFVEMAVQCETAHANGLNRFYFGKTSKPDLTLPSGATDQPYYILVAADGGSNVDASDANDTGAPVEASSGVNRRKQITFATATLQDRITWTGSLSGTSFHPNSLRGQFMVFLRARLSAASTVELNLRTFSDSGSVTYPTYVLTGAGSGGAGNTTYWQSIYMGVITLPFNEQRVVIGNDGLGIEMAALGDLVLQAERTGAATNLYVADLILVPFDEGAFVRQSGAALGVGNSFVFDNTGYYLRGRPGMYTSDTSFLGLTTEDRGSEFYLSPGKRNRLIMYADLSPNLAGTEAESGIDASYRIRLNIVPRWSGLRDA